MIKKVYGPYTDKNTERKKVIILYKDGTRRTVQYARYLMEEKLGRQLKDTEEVDHIDRDKTNDSIENLRVVDKSKHREDDSAKLVPVEWTCPMCLVKFVFEDRKREVDAFQKRKQGKAGPFCSKKCAGKYGAEVRFGKRDPIPVDFDKFETEHKKLRRIDPRFKDK